MAVHTGILSPGDIATVYSRTAITPGTVAFDTDGNEYLFLKGVVSTVAGSWVTYDANDDFQTALLTASAFGPVAVAPAAIVAGKWGWYQIWGKVVACSVEYIEDNSTDIGRSSADGFVGGGASTTTTIYAVICRSATEEDSGNTTTLFQIYYPFVGAGAH